MKRMRFVIALALSLVLVLSVSGCAKKQSPKQPADSDVPAASDEASVPGPDFIPADGARDDTNSGSFEGSDVDFGGYGGDEGYTCVNDGAADDPIVDTQMPEAIKAISEKNGWPSEVSVEHTGGVSTLFWTCNCDDLYLSLTLDHIAEDQGWYKMENHFTPEYLTRVDTLGEDALLKGSADEGKALFGSMNGDTTHLYYMACSEDYFVKCVMNTYDGRDYDVATELLNELLAVVRPG